MSPLTLVMLVSVVAAVSANGRFRYHPDPFGTPGYIDHYYGGDDYGGDHYGSDYYGGYDYYPTDRYSSRRDHYFGGHKPQPVHKPQRVHKPQPVQRRPFYFGNGNDNGNCDGNCEDNNSGNSNGNNNYGVDNGNLNGNCRGNCFGNKNGNENGNRNKKSNSNGNNNGNCVGNCFHNKLGNGNGNDNKGGGNNGNNRGNCKGNCFHLEAGNGHGNNNYIDHRRGHNCEGNCIAMAPKMNVHLHSLPTNYKSGNLHCTNHAGTRYYLYPGTNCNAVYEYGRGGGAKKYSCGKGSLFDLSLCACNNWYFIDYKKTCKSGMKRQ